MEYEEVVRQNPSFLPGRLNLGLSLFAAGRKAEAADQWNEVLRISPGNHSAELYLKFADKGSKVSFDKVQDLTPEQFLEFSEYFPD